MFYQIRFQDKMNDLFFFTLSTIKTIFNFWVYEVLAPMLTNRGLFLGTKSSLSHLICFPLFG